jgi:hypothetical protein
MEELRRWRQHPFTFAPLAMPRGYTQDPIVVHDPPDDALGREPAPASHGVTEIP